MEKKINKGNIAIFATAGLLTITIAAGVGLTICESNIDHLHEYCPFNVIDAQHQVNKINDNYVEDGIRAYYSHDDETTIYSDLVRVEADGQVLEVAPKGFIINGSQAEKNILLDSSGDVIVITQGTPIYPEGAEPGDIIKKSEIGVWDPEVVNVIEVPKRTR